MRAVVVHGAKDVRIEEREPAVPGPGEIQVAITHAGVCGSDLHYYNEGKIGNFTVREPLVVGHEVSGRVAYDPRVETDPDHALAPGTPVTIHPGTNGTPVSGLEDRPSIWPGGRYLGSAATWPHTQGAMSDRFTCRVDQIRVLPAELPLERAVLAEPLGVALHAINRAGGVAGKRVLVSGAGPIGLLAAGAAVVLGASEVTITDMLTEPFAIARTLNVSRTLQIGVDEIPREAFDVVLECAGAPAALSQAVQSAARGGVIVQVGMLPGDARPVALSELISREIDLRGAFRFNDEIDDAVEMLAAHAALGTVVTDSFAASDAVAAFVRAADPTRSSKVILTF